MRPTRVNIVRTCDCKSLGCLKFLAKRLKLKVNKAKSAVAKPSVRKFMGFSFTGGKTPRRRSLAKRAPPLPLHPSSGPLVKRQQHRGSLANPK